MHREASRNPEKKEKRNETIIAKHFNAGGGTPKKPKDFEKSKQQWRPQLQQGPRGSAHPHSHKVLLCHRVKSLRDEERRRRSRLMLFVHLDTQTS